MKIMFIGCGNMGKALIEGFAKSEAGNNADIYINDSDKPKAEALAMQLQLQGLVDIAAAEEMDAIVLAVKPDIVPDICKNLEGRLKKKQLLISVAAGVDISSLRSFFPDTAICRAMPNIAALVGEACTSLSFDNTSSEQEKIAETIFSACGRYFVLSEKYIDAVVGLSGSGPAYVMLMIEALADGAVKMGLPRDAALEMATQTLKGSAVLLEKEKLHPATVKDMVCSPGGTSIAAVHVLEEQGLRAALIAAVEASAQRNRALADKGK